VSNLSTFLRERAQADVERLPAEERVELALALGDADLELFCQASGLAPGLARARLRAARTAGRRESQAANQTGSCA
jgi:hypothetical protein